jgi:hypothetical protein
MDFYNNLASEVLRIFDAECFKCGTLGRQNPIAYSCLREIEAVRRDIQVRPP